MILSFYRTAIIFNESGTVNKVIQLDRYYPLSFGLTRSNKYMMYCTSVNEEKVSTVSLSLFDDKMEIDEELMSLECDVPYVTPILSFSQNGDRLWRTRQTLWGAMQMLTQNCCQTIHEEWYVHDSFYLCAEAFDF